MQDDVRDRRSGRIANDHLGCPVGEIEIPRL
jgi:hypothetical protein